MIVTTFKSLYDTRPHQVTPEVVFANIRTGGKHLEVIKKLRSTEDKKERESLKKELGVILWSGKFRERNIEGLEEYSRIICLDFDDQPDSLKNDFIKKRPEVYAAFTSPSGKGFKVLIKVATNNHAGHFAALLKEYPQADKSGKDVSRACFTSWAPDIYVNNNSLVYTKFVENAITDEQKFEKLKTWLENKGDHFVEGSRNSFLAKLAGACNRFSIPKEVAYKSILRDFVSHDSTFSEREAASVLDSIYNRYESQFGSVSFDDVMDDAHVDDILSTEVNTQDIILLDDVREDLFKDYDTGTQKGETTYFPELDNHFRFMRGELTVLNGVGNFGKSAWKKHEDLIRAVKEGKKFAYFSPEEWPPLFWYRELIRTYVGKPVEKDHPGRMTRKEYQTAMDFIKEHFFFIYPPMQPTPDYILERFMEVIIKYKIDGCTIDPYNGLLHSMNKRDDIFLAEQLVMIERFAQQQSVYFTIIAHPTKTPIQEDGNYRKPTPYDLLGGSTWNARATNILTYHRPYYITDPSDPTCEVTSFKIKKQQLCGIPGTAVFQYDRNAGRFYSDGFNPLDN